MIVQCSFTGNKLNDSSELDCNGGTTGYGPFTKTITSYLIEQIGFEGDVFDGEDTHVLVYAGY